MSRMFWFAAIVLWLSPALLFADPAAATAPATQPAKILDLQIVERDGGTPLEKVKIELSGDAGDQKLITGPDGHVAFPVPNSGRFYLEARLDGYVNRVLQWRDSDHDPIPAKYTMEIETGTPIKGKVADDEGKPISGATVVIEIREAQARRDAHERNSVSFESVQSNADGTWSYAAAPKEFELAELGVWDYDYASGEFFAMQRFPEAKTRDGSLTLTLARGVPILGTVVDQDDKPVKDARVWYGGEMASNKMPGQKTGDDGKFHYAAKQGERVVLTVLCKGYAPELTTIDMGSDKEEPKITLSPAKTMKGRIVGPDGEPVPNAWVFPDTWRGFRSLETRIHADKDGKFIWKEAPVDEVKCDIDGSQSGYVRESMGLTASDDDLTITLRKALHVSGTVVDEETGKPIDVFRVVPGIDWRNGNQAISWQRDESQSKSRGGKFEYSETWARPGYAVRIEADGYLPDQQSGFTLDDHDVHFDFKLKKAENLKLTVKKPDGSPAAKVHAYLVLAGQNINVSDGTDVNNHACAEAVTDAAGHLEFPPQSDDYAIYVASADGVAQVDQAAVADSNTITLTAWAKIEGTLYVDGNPTAGEEVSVTPAAPMRFQRNVPRIFQNLGVKTDAQGKFKFDHVAPGEVKVFQEKQTPVNDPRLGNRNVFTITELQTQTITVNAGESTTVNLGDAPTADQK